MATHRNRDLRAAGARAALTLFMFFPPFAWVADGASLSEQAGDFIPGYGRFSGHVVDSETGGGVGPVEVYVRHSDGREFSAVISSDPTDGSYSFPQQIPAGTYWAWVRRAGTLGFQNQIYPGVDCGYSCLSGLHSSWFDEKWIPGLETFAVQEAADTVGVDFSLHRLSTLSGRVTDSRDGSPIGGVEIISEHKDTDGFFDWGPGYGQALTDSDGRYELMVPSGQVMVQTRFSVPDALVGECYDDVSLALSSYFRSECAEIEVPVLGNVTGINFSLEEGGRIAGSVFDLGISQPVEGLRIEFYLIPDGADTSPYMLGYAYTTADGSYISRALTPGTYSVKTLSGVYLDQLWPGVECENRCDVTGGAPVTISKGTVTSGISFSLEPPARISGVVTDRVTGLPLKSEEVVLFDHVGVERAAWYTDSDGRYSFAVAPGTYFVRAGTHWISDYSEWAWDAVACPKWPLGLCDITDADPIVVGDGDSITGIDIALAPAGRIGGTVTDAATGAPLGGVIIYVENSSGERVEASFTGVEGSFLTDQPLTSGSYFVRTNNPLGYQDELYDDLPCEGGCVVTEGSQVSVAEGSTTTVSFALEELGSVTGTATSAASGLPIAGLTVLVGDPYLFNVSTTTDDSGSWIMQVPDGSYNVWTGGDYQPFTRQVFDGIDCQPLCDWESATLVHSRLGSVVTDVDFSLQREGSLSGEVVDFSSGDRVEGINVEITNSSETMVRRTSTNRLGRYVFSDLPSDTYRVRSLSSTDYSGSVWNLGPCFPDCVTGSGTPVIFAPATPITDVDLTVLRWGSISGLVTDAVTASSIPGVMVEASNLDGESVRGYTDTEGRYSISYGLSPGYWFVRTAGSPGYADELYDDLPCSEGCREVAGVPVAVGSGEETSDIDFALDRSGLVTGTVRSSVGAQPLEEVVIDVFDSDLRHVGSTETDSAGYWSMDLRPGLYRLQTAAPQGWIDQVWAQMPCIGVCEPSDGLDVEVHQDQTTSGIDFSLDPAGSISGRVTEEGTGNTISGITVRVFSGTAQATFGISGANGSWTTRDALPPGSYTVRTSNSLGWIDQVSPEPVEVIGGSDTGSIDFSLKRGLRLGGRAQDQASGLPLRYVRIMVTDTGGAIVATGETDADGVWISKNGVEPGSYRVHTWNALGYANEAYPGVPCPTYCTVSHGDLLNVATDVSGLDFDLEKSGSIAGYVGSDVDGGPLSGVPVGVHDAVGNLVTLVRTDDQGGFTVGPPLHPGTYFLETRNVDGYLDELYDGIPCEPSCNILGGSPVQVAAGATTSGVNFSLGISASITGRVFDAETGIPLADIRVIICDASGTVHAQAWTDADGVFAASSGIPSGSYFARTANSFMYVNEFFGGQQAVKGDLVGGDPIEVVGGVPRDGIDFVLERGGGFSGTVTAEGTGEPLSDILIMIHARDGSYLYNTQTQEDGSYTSWVFGGLPQDSYVVRTSNAESSGFADELFDDRRWSPSFPALGDPILVSPGTQVSGIDLALPRSGDIVFWDGFEYGSTVQWSVKVD